MCRVHRAAREQSSTQRSSFGDGGAAGNRCHCLGGIAIRQVDTSSASLANSEQAISTASKEQHVITATRAECELI